MVTVKRYQENPLIRPEDVPPYHKGFEVIGTFNAGVAEYHGEILLLLRVAERPISHDPARVLSPYYDLTAKRTAVRSFNRSDPAYQFGDSRVVGLSAHPDQFAGLTSLSYLRLARSRDGHHFTVDPKPFIYPATRYQTFGIEDPRITQIGDVYYIYFSAVSPLGIGINLVTTRDFITCEDHGLIFSPEDKDAVIFPEKIGDRYYALHRPSPKSVGNPDIWLAESDNLRYWGHHRHLLGVRKGFWDSARIGSGAVPIRTADGWLEIYHGMDAQNRYCLGALLLDLKDPAKILARSAKPILEPEADYEKHGFFGAVVFTCGALVHGSVLQLYYGVSDRSMAGAELDLGQILAGLKTESA
jgi:predicted GH43/DUF377 family glycosyl hydrolase